MTALDAIKQTIAEVTAGKWSIIVAYGADLQQVIASETVIGPTVIIAVGADEPKQRYADGRASGFRETFALYLRSQPGPGEVEKMQPTYRALRDAIDGRRIPEPEGRDPQRLAITSGSPMFAGGFPEAQLQITAE